MPKTKYEHIYQELLERINSQQYQPNTFIPSEHTLVKEFSASRNTIRRAILQLIDKGIVQAIHGKGVLVIGKNTDDSVFSIGKIESFTETTVRNNLPFTTQLIQFEIITITEQLALQTGLPLGKKSYHIKRVRSLNGKNLILDESFFLADIVKDLNETICQSSIYNYLENTLGIVITMSKRKISCRLAKQSDQQWLPQGQGSYLMIVEGNVYEKNGTQFEYTISKHIPEYFSFEDVALRKNS